MFHTVLEKYLLALCDFSECDVMLIPAMRALERGGRMDLANILERLDGVLLPGGRSMVDPREYAGGQLADGSVLDPERDATVLPLIQAACCLGMPVLGICRGFQEMCCAFGGALLPELDRKEIDHRAPPAATYEDKYRPTHGVRCEVDGWLAGLLAREALPTEFPVNSLHLQGAAQIGPQLQVQARSGDGLIEAVSLAGANFILGVQWHPEWHLESHAQNRAIFRAFGAACRVRRDQRQA